MSKNRGIYAAHTCIPQYREYPPPRREADLLYVAFNEHILIQHIVDAYAFVILFPMEKAIDKLI